MTEPTTAAGRALLAERDKRRPVSWERARIVDAILAIEAEARTPAEPGLERLTAWERARIVASILPIEAGVHTWFCGERGHRSGTRPISGWACERGAAVIRAALSKEPHYTEDDPDWSAMVSPIDERDGGHSDR